MGLTGSEDDHITSNDNALAIAKESLAEVSVVILKDERGGMKPYKPIGKNCPIPPRIINPPTARLTSRTAKRETRL